MLSRTTPRLLAVVFTVMILLFVLTGFLTRSYHREKIERARQLYEAGQRHADEGRFEEAIECYSEALTMDREAPEYRQALALALMEAGRTGEAETYFLELTAGDPANGLANLMLARIHAGLGDLEKAQGFYQRAIYGFWPEDPVSRRTETRFELVGLLAQAGENLLARAELLRLLEEIPEDPEAMKQIARLFLDVGDPENAASLFGRVAEKNPRDAQAHAGLGDAEFELGHYYSARTAYTYALLHNPGDLQSSMQRDLATEVIELDPMRRRISSGQRLTVSRQLVARSLSAVEYCLPENLEELPEEFREPVNRARDVAVRKIRQPATAEAVEANIDLAEQLRQFRINHCAAPPVPDRALELVLESLAD